jgi:hypothetical protein
MASRNRVSSEMGAPESSRSKRTELLRPTSSVRCGDRLPIISLITFDSRNSGGEAVAKRGRGREQGCVGGVTIQLSCTRQTSQRGVESDGAQYHFRRTMRKVGSC